MGKLFEWGCYLLMLFLLILLLHPFYVPYLMRRAGIALKIPGLFFFADVHLKLAAGAVSIHLEKLKFAIQNRKLLIKFGKLDIKVISKDLIDVTTFRLERLLSLSVLDFTENLAINLWRLVQIANKSKSWDTRSGSTSNVGTAPSTTTNLRMELDEVGVLAGSVDCLISMLKMVIFKILQIETADIILELKTERTRTSQRKSPFSVLMVNDEVDTNGLFTFELKDPQLSLDHSTVGYSHLRSKDFLWGCPSKL